MQKWKIYPIFSPRRNMLIYDLKTVNFCNGFFNYWDVIIWWLIKQSLNYLISSGDRVMIKCHSLLLFKQQTIRYLLIFTLNSTKKRNC
jgi:hypothetical protein